jgi:hypothetical protein
MINERDLSFSRGVAENFWPVALGRVVTDVSKYRVLSSLGSVRPNIRHSSYDIGFMEFNAIRFRRSSPEIFIKALALVLYVSLQISSDGRC